MLALNKNNNINFTSKKLYPVKLPNAGDKEYTKGFLTELNCKDDLDIFAIKQISDGINQEAQNRAGRCLCRDFLKKEINKNISYYALEQDSESNLSDKILGLAKTDNQKGLSDLDYIYVKSEFRKENPARKFKNLGKVFMGCMINESEKLKIAGLNFRSTCDEFYLQIFKEAGIKLCGIKSSFHRGDQFTLSKFYIDNSDFERYLNYMEKEFGIKFLKK